MTHLCSPKLTHTWNTICPWARPIPDKGTDDVIHAAGVHSAPDRSFLGKDLPLLARQASLARPDRRWHPIWSFARAKLHHRGAVVGQFWRAYPGHFSRVPKLVDVTGVYQDIDDEPGVAQLPQARIPAGAT